MSGLKRLRGTAEIISVIVGPAEHGVTRHAEGLAGAAGIPVARYANAAQAIRDVGVTCRRAEVCHWHFTDRLFGDDVETAARRFVELTGQVPARHVVSLHDVPASGRSTRNARRVAAYRTVAATAAAVVVASTHERHRLRRVGINANAIVIPLPVSSPRSSLELPLGPSTPRSIGVLGFVYPGKGHGAVIAATAALPPDVEVLALGTVSPGHENLARHLRLAAAAAGRTFRLTGFLGDHALAQALASVAVPVVAARAVSASASLGTWLGAGRRPIAVRNRYVDELTELAPWLITRCEPDGLASAIGGALDDPASTWRNGPLPPELTQQTVVAAHRALYAQLQR